MCHKSTYIDNLMQKDAYGINHKKTYFTIYETIFDLRRFVRSNKFTMLLQECVEEKIINIGVV